MRRLVAWMTGAAGGLAAYRALRRRRHAPEALPESGPDPRAEELRARLAEARAAGDDRAEFESGEQPVDEAAAPGDADVRRREVHERGRAAIDEMQGPDAAA